MEGWREEEIKFLTLLQILLLDLDHKAHHHRHGDRVHLPPLSTPLPTLPPPLPPLTVTLPSHTATRMEGEGPVEEEEEGPKR